MAERRKPIQQRKEQQPKVYPRLEAAAETAVAEYLSISPDIHIGRLSAKRLQNLRNAIAQGKQTPERRWHMLSLDWETTDALLATGQVDGREDLFTRAIATADALVKDRTTPPDIRIHAALTRLALPAYQAILGGPDTNGLFRPGGKTIFTTQQDRLAKQALVDYRKADSSSDILMHTLTTMCLVNLSGASLFVMPTPSRYWAAPSSEEQSSHLYIVHLREGRTIQLPLIADNSQPGIPIQLLAQDQYTSTNHPFGALQATIDTQYLLRKNKKGENLNTKDQKMLDVLRSYFDDTTPPLIEHIQEAFNDLAAQIKENKRLSPLERARSNYSVLPPTVQAIDTNRVDTITDAFDAAHEQNELTPAEQEARAWLHTELMMRDAEGRSAEGHYGTAALAFRTLAESAYRQNDTIGLLRNNLASITLPLYRSLALGEDTTAILPQYKMWVSQLAQQAMYAHEQEINPQRQAELQQFMQEVTIYLLAATTDPTDTFIAVPSMQRQRREKGWTTTLWEQTPEGFKQAHTPQQEVQREQQIQQAFADDEVNAQEILPYLIEEVHEQPKAADSDENYIQARRHYLEYARDKVLLLTQ